MSEASQTTRLLQLWREGDQAAMEQLLPHVYDELMRIAGSLMRGERAGHTLQTTALVHEAYMRLVGKEVSVQDRVHFMSLAARAMRRILVEHARGKQRVKRGGGAVQVTLEEDLAVSEQPPDWLLDADAALQRLERQDERKAKVFELQLFAGMTHPEIAELLQVSLPTVERDLRFARAWIRSELSEKDPPPDGGQGRL